MTEDYAPPPVGSHGRVRRVDALRPGSSWPSTDSTRRKVRVDEDVIEAYACDSPRCPPVCRLRRALNVSNRQAPASPERPPTPAGDPCSIGMLGTVVGVRTRLHGGSATTPARDRCRTPTGPDSDRCRTRRNKPTPAIETTKADARAPAFVERGSGGTGRTTALALDLRLSPQVTAFCIGRVTTAASPPAARADRLRGPRRVPPARTASAAPVRTASEIGKACGRVSRSCANGRTPALPSAFITTSR